MRIRIRPAAATAFSLAISVVVILTGSVAAMPTGAVAANPVGTGGVLLAPTLPAATCALSVTPAGPLRTCELWAKPGSVNLPGLSGVAIWGYAATEAAPATLPGPVIVVEEGDAVVTILHNRLGTGDPTSLSIPGMSGLSTDQTGAADGADTSYEFVAADPGTFLYQAGPLDNGPRQVAMGLYGAFVVRPSADPSRAYADAATAFDTEHLIVASEIDPALNEDPGAFDMRDYAPTYWLFNGEAYPDSDPILVVPGQRLLLRWANAGLENPSFDILGLHQRVLAANGHRLGLISPGGPGDPPTPYTYDVVAETIPAGTTLDAIVELPTNLDACARLPVMSASGHLNNAAQMTGGLLAVGGQLSFIENDLIFADGFESGSTAAWSTATASGLAVVASAAHEGSNGLRVTLSGSAARYVTDRRPCAERTYHGRFYFDPNGSLPAGAETILDGRSATGASILRAQLRRSSGKYQIRAGFRTTGGYVNTGWFTVTDDWHAIEIGWSAAVAGRLDLYIDGTLKQTRTGNSQAYRLEEVRLGAVAGLGSSSSGTQAFDDYASARHSLIGP
jgi:multicopper oxidase